MLCNQLKKRKEGKAWKLIIGLKNSISPGDFSEIHPDDIPKEHHLMSSKV